MKEFDLILWGATGYTGQLVAEYLAHQASPTLKWGIAGRNEAKLEEVREGLAEIKPDLATLPILLADSFDRASLDGLAVKTKVICSTVGPYWKYGTELVAACVAAGIAYCDLTGEMLWVRQMVDAFQEEAERTGARIVHSCGFDSIPSDLGVLMVQEFAYANYGRYCEAITHTVMAMRGGLSGGTLATLVGLLEAAQKDKEKRKLLADPYSLVPGYKHDWSEKDQMGVVYDERGGYWTGPFVMASANSRIVRRSHALQDWRYGEDFHYVENLRFGSGLRGRLQALGFSLGLGAFVGMVSVPFLRNILLKTFLPGPGEGPAPEEREAGFFRTKVRGRLTAEGGEVVWIEGKVAGTKDPGYGETAKMLGESALCLALDDLPEVSGILTPAVAMGMTLVERLRLAGMTFVVEIKEG
ncbi:MAG TPA: saccharopine dehydrogenase NADP-binding domain-containing protein [Anaerolineae bacterium]|nr:saccharopine dehydrogenase NADP-binding domain-containing protein [Anaerolineae bacterium]